MIRLFFCLLSATVLLPAQRPAPFDVVEATVAQVHDAMAAAALAATALAAAWRHGAPGSPHRSAGSSAA